MARRLHELLNDLSVMRQAQALSVLQKRFDAVLPARFRGEADVVALEAGELRVLCSNGAIAGRLRLEAGSLASQLAGKGLPVRRVSIKVRPACRAPRPQQPKAPLPPAARHAFKAAVDALEDGQVKSAIRALLGHHSS